MIRFIPKPLHPVLVVAGLYFLLVWLIATTPAPGKAPRAGAIDWEARRAIRALEHRVDRLESN